MPLRRPILLVLVALVLAAAPFASAGRRGGHDDQGEDKDGDHCRPNPHPCPWDECYAACDREDDCGNKVHCPAKPCQDPAKECRNNKCKPKCTPKTEHEVCYSTDECYADCDRDDGCGNKIHCTKRCEEGKECKEGHCKPKCTPKTKHEVCYSPDECYADCDRDDGCGGKIHCTKPCGEGKECKEGHCKPKCTPKTEHEVCYSTDECYADCDRDDGCGNKIHCTKRCEEGKECKEGHCKPKTTECPAECHVYKNGMKFTGHCSKTRPEQTICGGDGGCPAECGQCYIDDRTICGTSNGKCSRAGKCRCFKSKKGASCKADNIMGEPGIDLSKIDNGGGCDESMCNAFSRENGGGPMACCAYDCK